MMWQNLSPPVSRRQIMATDPGFWPPEGKRNSLAQVLPIARTKLLLQHFLEQF